MAAVSLFWNTNMAAVTSCESALYVRDNCLAQPMPGSRSVQTNEKLGSQDGGDDKNNKEQYFYHLGTPIKLLCTSFLCLLKTTKGRFICNIRVQLSHLTAGIFYFFRLQNNINFQLANATAIRTRMLQLNPPQDMKLLHLFLNNSYYPQQFYRLYLPI